jgi:hypothetical protein
MLYLGHFYFARLGHYHFAVTYFITDFITDLLQTLQLTAIFQELIICTIKIRP